MFEKIVEIIADKLVLSDEKIEKITLETNVLDDLNADSLEIVEILMALDDTFGVNVPDEDVPTLKTVKDIVDYVEKHQ